MDDNSFNYCNENVSKQLKSRKVVLLKIIEKTVKLIGISHNLRKFLTYEKYFQN